MKRIVILADLQTGSDFAVASEKAKRTASQYLTVAHSLTPIQRVLYNHLRLCSEKYANPDLLIMLGEGMEGIKEGRNIWSTNINDQIEDCVELIKLFNPKQVEFLQASDWHIRSKDGTYYDETLAMTYYGKDNSWREHYHDDLHLKIENCLFHFAHHISVSKATWQYRTTPLARELVLALLNIDALYNYNGIFRGHAHYFCTAGYSHHTGFICPGYSWRTPFGVKYSPYYAITIGMMYLEVNDREFSWKLDKIDAPKPKLIEVL